MGVFVGAFFRMRGLDLRNLIDPTLGLSQNEWLDKIEDIALDHGDFEPLGPDHSAIMIQGGDKILVTFERIDDVRNQVNQDTPLSWQLQSGQDWTVLTILGSGESWFRHRAVYEYFDKLIDDGFFDQFETVVFYGSGACGYAATAYSVSAPGATVIAMSPQATLDPSRAGWDPRFVGARRTDFTSRFGFAPHMAEAAEKVFVFYDPEESLDAMHAALFSGDNVIPVKCRYFDGQIEIFLRRMEVLPGLIQMAMRDRLTRKIISRGLRERRNYLPYLRRLLGAVDNAERTYLTALLCRAVLDRINAPRFHRRLGQAEKQLAAEGRALPARRLAKSA